MASSGTEGLSIRRFHGTGGVRLWMSGVIDERFPADAFANTHGVIVVDLAGIRRITSFGIREWARALATIDTAQLYFVEVAECLIPQFAMVGGFAGGGQIVSYREPYECDACGATEEHTFDRRVDPDSIWNGEPPTFECKACKQRLRFADIAESTRIALLLGGPLRTVPALAEVEAGGASDAAPTPTAAPGSAKLRLNDAKDARAKPGAGQVAWAYPFEVHKEVVGDATVLWISGTLDAVAGFRHVGDGLEGNVVIAAPRILACDDAGIAVLHKTITAATANGGRVLFARCAPTLVAALARHKEVHAGLSLVSVEELIACSRCKSDAPCFATTDPAGKRGTFCPRCGTPCTVANDVLRAAIEQLPCAPTPPWLPRLISSLPQKLEARVPRPPRPKWVPALAALATLLIATLGVGAYLLLRHPKKRLPFDPTIVAEAPADDAPEEQQPTPTPTATPTPRPVAKKRSVGGAPKGAELAAAAAEPSPAPKSRDARKLADSLDGKRIGELEPGDDASSLPALLTKAQIDASMAALGGAVRSCYAQFRVAGELPVRGTIAPSGRLQGGAVVGPLAGTPTGQCVEKVVRRASFPRFAGASMPLSYTYTVP